MEKICVDCGCVIENDDYIINANGDYVCSDCSWDYYECAECGELVHVDHLVYLERYDIHVCDDCLSRYYVTCEECGEIVAEDDYDFDRGMCDECASRSVIKPYHFHKHESRKFFTSDDHYTMSPGGDEYHGGIELELQTDDYPEECARDLQEILGSHAYFEEDCSVPYGFETIFEPHTFDAILSSDVIKRAFEYMAENMYANSETGLHVHVSRCAFGATRDEQDDNIAKLVALHTQGHAFDTLAKLARREDFYYCGALSARNKRKQEAKAFANGCGSHGVALNCGNYNTVEFRLGQATTDYNEFIAWIKIIQMLVERSKTIPFESATNIYAWFAYADDTVKEYMADNGVVWEEPIEITTFDYVYIIDSLCAKINDQLRAQSLPTIDNSALISLLAVNSPTQVRATLGYL